MSELEREIHRMLAPAAEAGNVVPDWPADSLLLPENPDAMLGALMARYAPSAQMAAAQLTEHFGATSSWMDREYPSPQEIGTWLADVTLPLRQIPLANVIAYRFADAGALDGWMRELTLQAVPFWQWDPTVLSDGERVSLHTLTLCLASTEVAALLSSDGSAMRLLPFEYDDRLAIVTLRSGMPCVASEDAVTAGGTS